MMRILTGGIYHETHSFSNIPTNVDSFRRVLLLEDEVVIEQLAGTTSEMAGFIEGAGRFGFELIPTLWAWGVSTGPVTAETFDHCLGILRRALEREGPVDGILFALHGACVGERVLDGDGYILAALRSMVGADVPIVATLDFHANISEQMVEMADALVGYDTYPHIDQVERGLEAAELLFRTIKGEIRPVMALAKPPMMIPVHKQLTDAHPMKDLFQIVHGCEQTVERLLSVTLSGGFAYSDVPEVGAGIVVVTDGDPDLAQRLANDLSDRVWALRSEFVPHLPSVEEAVSLAVGSDEWPVILADVGDNIGAGTPGDSTFLLRELIDQGAEGAVVIIADPEAVAGAVEAGVGNRVTLSVGGKCDRLHGDPLTVEGYVKIISDGIFTNRGHMRDGIVEKMGRCAVVYTHGIKLVLTEIKMPPWNLEQLRSVGIAPEHEKILALKSTVAFRAAYEPIARRIIEVDSPGLAATDLSRFDYRHIRRPIFPLDEWEERTRNTRK